MPEIKTFNLEQAQREGDVFDLAQAIYRGDIPGFQDNRMDALPITHRMGHLLGVMDEIEDASQAVVGTRIPFSHAPGIDGNNTGSYAPHVDTGFRGLAIHKNNLEGGDVFLAHPAVNPQPSLEETAYLLPGDTVRDYTGIGMPGLAHAIKDAKVHRGKLTTNGLTVFSEGNIKTVTPDGAAYVLEPAMHHFQRETPSGWTRYDSQLKDEDLSPKDLAAKSRKMRAHIASLDLSHVQGVKWQQIYENPTSNEIPVADILAHPGMYTRPTKTDAARLGWRERRFVRKQVAQSIDHARQASEKHRSSNS